MTVAALLVHGFGGDRTVWDFLAARLEGPGVIVSRLSLAGHGEDSDALATTPWTTWVGEARSGIAELRDSGATHVCLVGYSMGATIGLHVLADRLVDSAVLISPSVTVPVAQRAAVAALSTARVRAIPRRMVGTKDDSNPGQMLPVAALKANLDLKDRARALTLADPAPTLLIAGGEDDVASPQATVEVLRRFPVGTRLATLAGGDHGLPDGVVAPQVADLVQTFLAGEARR